MLLICAVVFLRSAIGAAAADPGLRTTDTLLVRPGNDGLAPAMSQALTTDSSVVALASSGRGDTRARTDDGTTRDANYMAVSSNYFSTLDIRLIRGRGFTSTEDDAARSAVFSESLAQRLWPNGNAIGRVVSLGPFPDAREIDLSGPSGTYTVVGIAQDVAAGAFSLGGAGGSSSYLTFHGVYVPRARDSRPSALLVRVHGDPELARRELLARLARVDPSGADVTTVRTMVGMSVFLMNLGFWLTVSLGSIALLLTSAGLFGVVSYVVAQRATELGVRMALGARAPQIVWLVLTQVLRPVGTGVLAGSVFAASLGTLLMRMAGARPSDVSAIRPLDPAAYLLSLLLVVAACIVATLAPVMRATRIDPVAAIRQD
jgi:hypothetical protein